MPRGRSTGTGRGTRRGGASTQESSSTADANQGDDATNAVEISSASVTPSQSRATSVASARPSTGTRATTRGASTGRFRPRNIRRDEAERNDIARQEEDKASKRAADERRARGRTRVRSNRSRGDAMGARGGLSRMTASGPFAGGFGASSSGWGGSSRSGGGPGLAGPSAGGSIPEFSRRMPKTEPGEGDFKQATIDRVRETRINADKLHTMTPGEELDSDDEATMAALASAAETAMPMGIYRRVHKDSGVVVATTAELEAAENDQGGQVEVEEEESLWVDDSGAPIHDQPEQDGGVWDSSATKVKQEPTDDSYVMDVALPSAAAGGERKTVKVVKKTVPLDPEERIIQSDMDLLASELGGVSVTGEDGTTRTEIPSNKAGRLYLFQFPPLLPPLELIESAATASAVKPEPEDVDMLNTTTPATTSDPVDLTAEQQDRDGHVAGAAPEADNTKGFLPSLLSQGGCIGKLNVRKSGKVELDWGGRVLEVAPAMAMHFQTTAVIVEPSDDKPAVLAGHQQPQDPGQPFGGESVGMGKIMGKFVLAPAWDEEEEWAVTEEDLAIPEETE